MVSKVFIADLQILGAALLFGIAFIGQRVVMVDGMGPMTCNSLRFGLSTILLLFIRPCMPKPISSVASLDQDDDFDSVIAPDARKSEDTHHIIENLLGANLATFFVGAKKTVLFWGVILGILNFFGSGFQQWGIAYTSASKIAFIAGFDLFLTPVFVMLLPSQKIHANPNATTWFAVVLSVVGLYLLSDARLDELDLGQGETLGLISTVFWTLHIIYTDMASVYTESVGMVVVQLGTVTLLSTIGSLVWEQQEWVFMDLIPFMPWILFLAITEAAAFTLVAIGQAYAPPTHAALLLSLEGVFATIADYIALGEVLTRSELVGCALMVTATLIAELKCNCIPSRHASSGYSSFTSLKSGSNKEKASGDLSMASIVNANSPDRTVENSNTGVLFSRGNSLEGAEAIGSSPGLTARNRSDSHPDESIMGKSA